MVAHPAQNSGCEVCGNQVRCGLLNIACGLANDFGLSIRVEEFSEDAPIPTLEDCLLVVKLGAAKAIYRDARGQARVVGFTFPGDLIALEILAGTGHSGVDYKALVPKTSVCRVRIHPTSAKRVSAHFCQRLSAELATRIRANYRYRQIVMEPAQVRMAYFLMQIMGSAQGQVGANAAILPNIARADIASYLHLRVETVSRILSTFRQNGYVRGPLHCLEVVDLAALAALIQFRHNDAHSLSIQSVENAHG